MTNDPEVNRSDDYTLTLSYDAQSMSDAQIENLVLVCLPGCGYF